MNKDYWVERDVWRAAQAGYAPKRRGSIGKRFAMLAGLAVGLVALKWALGL